MPDGFNPHVELERIYNLRELMVACRERTPKIMKLYDQALESEDVPLYEKIKITEILLNRGYGKPRQHVVINEVGENIPKRVQVYLPDNGRTNVTITNTIDAEQS